MADLTVVNDSVYSFEIARRAVGRAALHLGIDSMTEQTLDVMADVLLQYLSRTGKAMSILAESSRRTSAHVNVLDAFQACQLVASPAVGRLHLQEPEEEEEDMIVTPSAKTANGAGTEGSNGASGANAVGSPSASVPSNGGLTQPSNVSTSSSHSSTGWKGLAAFVFGPNWLQEKDDDEYLMELAAARNTDASDGEGREISSGGAGGKVFPSSLENGDGGDGGITGEMGELGRKRNRRKGWDAPYPDEVAAFPRASSTCANPHALPPRVTGVPSTATSNDSVSAYRKVDVDAEEAEENEEEAQNELEALSDDVFLPSAETMDSNMPVVGDSTWGSIGGKTKRKVDGESDSATKTDDDGDVEMQPASKKVKFEDANAKADNAKGDTSSKKGSGVSISGGEGRAKGNGETEGEDEFLYIPQFYPRPPSMKVVVDDRRTVVDDMDDRQERLLQQQRTQEQQERQVFASSASDEMLDESSTSLRNTIDINSSKGVRSSLVRMGNNSYWGSGWDKPSSTTASATSTLAVPMGRKIVNSSASSGKAAPEDPIIPMSRASGSRVSRVLEGSMDAAAMQ
mmetsp:Transcript_23170/g.54782  ORF Transcript_23170/g.54782 Transcript_23170/m.54782 type:complete len:571 (-) Transcript_23170:185-1897(-)|eukprot:CAMPEP_0197178352 /NCGR_PEP_ID=MMETSP1423-20130617/3654_1 /TAXON_ID=476441 /ORGANISM="Pseudo-nitzschia heimii, Strain UNC1101" /LENGTH=570 /DNA_ID=CAMNT_0042628065 /DNA_START=158 /DNA_END=1870 /DNA_ORIENTATION=+